MNRRLVIAPQWIGDAVMSEPLLARLAARGGSITVAALPWVAPVYRCMPQVDEVIAMALVHGRLRLLERWRIARSLRARFDVAYVLPNSIKSALIPWLAGVPVRIGYRGEGRPWLLNRQLQNPVGRPPMVGFYSALAEVGEAGPPAALGAERKAKEPPHAGRASAFAERPQLVVADERVEAVLEGHGLQRSAYFAFAPGAEYGPAKRWPAAHYAELARALHAKSGLPIVLLGSAQEAVLCDAVAEAAPGACRVLAGAVTLDDAIALIAAAKGVVSNDSGLMHVAAAFGVPQVAVFGSTSPEHTPPLNGRAEVLWLKDELRLDCAPCFDRVCRFGHTRCLAGVGVERVEASLDRAMAAAPSGDALPVIWT
jgi:heptosyltransferase-2